MTIFFEDILSRTDRPMNADFLKKIFFKVHQIKMRGYFKDMFSMTKSPINVDILRISFSRAIY